MFETRSLKSGQQQKSQTLFPNREPNTVSTVPLVKRQLAEHECSPGKMWKMQVYQKKKRKKRKGI